MPAATKGRSITEVLSAKLPEVPAVAALKPCWTPGYSIFNAKLDVKPVMRRNVVRGRSRRHG